MEIPPNYLIYMLNSMLKLSLTSMDWGLKGLWVSLLKKDWKSGGVTILPVVVCWQTVTEDFGQK